MCVCVCACVCLCVRLSCADTTCFSLSTSLCHFSQRAHSCKFGLCVIVWDRVIVCVCACRGRIPRIPHCQLLLLSPVTPHTQEIEQLIDDPGSIVSLLGRTVPATGAFFTNYILLTCEFYKIRLFAKISRQLAIQLFLSNMKDFG